MISGRARRASIPAVIHGRQRHLGRAKSASALRTHRYLPPNPIIYFFASVIRGKTVALLDLDLKSITRPIDELEIVVREFAPLLLDLAFGLLPRSLKVVPVHRSLRTRNSPETTEAR